MKAMIDRNPGVPHTEATCKGLAEPTSQEEEWIDCRKYLPPFDMEVETKIDDDKGCRNQANLVRVRLLWFLPDKSMYVYYTPTHWRPAK